MLEEIAEDPILRNVKLIAEAWDSGGAFQVGRFPCTRWGEWNCHFRDNVRRFWRGDSGFSRRFASCISGSADLYQHHGQTPVKSINFVTSHDGFTLHDLVAYSRKHNEANSEDNRDGLDENYCANYGVEGATDDPTILETRLRQIKNFLATLLLARGVPMLLGGDEFARTQRGNSNAYCQDNEISWYDWNPARDNAHVVRFVQQVVKLRNSHPVLRAERFYSADEIEMAWAIRSSSGLGGLRQPIRLHHPRRLDRFAATVFAIDQRCFSRRKLGASVDRVELADVSQKRNAFKHHGTTTCAASVRSK